MDLKKDPNFKPKYSVLKEANLWSQEHRFKTTVHHWLLEGAPDWTVATTAKLLEKEGTIHKAKIDLGSKEEYFHWGEVSALLKARPVIDVIYLELQAGPQVVTDDMVAAISHGAKQEGGVRVVVVGPVKVVQQVTSTGALGKLAEGHAPLGGYKQRRLMLNLPRDEGLGPREHGDLNVERAVVLFSPVPIKPSMSYITSHVSWSAVIMSHIISLLEVVVTVPMSGWA